MAGPASPPSPFTLTLSINALPPFRNFFVPPKLQLPFEAQFYELSGPWVGTIDLDNAPQLKTKMYQAEGGYRVPPKGQVQLVIKNQLGTVMKVLLVPYDLKDMPAGTQAPLRRVWYGEAINEPHTETYHSGHEKDRDKEKDMVKEVIRYAVHLRFVCPSAPVPPQRPRAHSAGHPVTHRGPFSKFAMTSITSANVEHDTVESDDGEISSHSASEGASMSRGTSLTGTRKKVVRSASMDPRRIFLAGEIRLVFASRVPDEEEMVRAENEEGRVGERYYIWEGGLEPENQDSEGTHT
jgi:Chromosome segregation during meiosis